jgi:propionyl-CoA carboxylase alpha chain
MKVSQYTKDKTNLIAPITGLITDIKVFEGTKVQYAQHLATLEAMKMENILTSNVNGIVKKINYKKRSTVKTGNIIIEIEQ